MTIIINHELCRGCEACVDACPQEAIHSFEGKIYIDQKKCTVCEACIAVCPAGALELSTSAKSAIMTRPQKVEIIEPQTRTELAPEAPNWKTTLLSLAGQFLPRLADLLLTRSEQRLSQEKTEATQAISAGNGINRDRPTRRRRHRRGR